MFFYFNYIKSPSVVSSSSTLTQLDTMPLAKLKENKNQIISLIWHIHKPQALSTGKHEWNESIQYIFHAASCLPFPSLLDWFSWSESLIGVPTQLCLGWNSDPSHFLTQSNCYPVIHILVKGQKVWQQVEEGQQVILRLSCGGSWVERH